MNEAYQAHDGLPPDLFPPDIPTWTGKWPLGGMSRQNSNNPAARDALLHALGSPGRAQGWTGGCQVARQSGGPNAVEPAQRLATRVFSSCAWLPAQPVTAAAGMLCAQGITTSHTPCLAAASPTSARPTKVHCQPSPRRDVWGHVWSFTSRSPGRGLPSLPACRPPRPPPRPPTCLLALASPPTAALVHSSSAAPPALQLTSLF